MTVAKNLEKPSILVVDSDPNELKTLVIGLRLEGFDVHEAPTSVRAVEILKEQNFDAALVDLMMPEMNGLQLARIMRSSNPEITTILMSAYHLSPIQLSRANTGAVGFVPKPFKFDALVQFIRNKIFCLDGEQKTTVEEMPVFSHGGLHTPFDVPKSA